MDEITRYKPSAPSWDPSTLEPVDCDFFGTLEGPTRFYLCRHGQTVANAARVVQGLSDFPLDATGRAQAQALARWLADKGIDRVVASPLVRASETAAIVASRLGLPKPVLCEALREIDTGRFSGLSLDEARARHPADFAAFERQSWEGVPDAERSEAVRERALAAWAALRGEALSGARAVLCVSHGGFLQWLVRVTFGSRSWMPLLPTGNCGVFELLVEPGAAPPRLGAGADAPAAGRGQALSGGVSPLAGYGHPGGAKLFWERLNFIPPSDVVAVPPVF